MFLDKRQSVVDSLNKSVYASCANFLAAQINKVFSAFAENASCLEFFENDLIVLVEDLYSGAGGNIEAVSHLDRKHDPAKGVDLSNNT